MHWRGRLAVLVISLSLLVAGGCSRKCDVTGKVSYKGKTVVWGTVTLVDEAGEYHQGPIDLTGQYTVTKVPMGPVKIAVHTTDPHASRGKGGRGAGVRGAAGTGGADDPRAKFKTESPSEPPRPEKGKWFPLPTKLADPATSGLTGEVRKDQTLDIDIK